MLARQIAMQFNGRRDQWVSCFWFTKAGAHKVAALESIGKVPIKDVSSKKVLKIQKDGKIEKVVAMMHRKNIHAIPVYDGNRLVGIVGKHDILNIAFYSDSLV